MCCVHDTTEFATKAISLAMYESSQMDLTKNKKFQGTMDFLSQLKLVFNMTQSYTTTNTGRHKDAKLNLNNRSMLHCHCLLLYCCTICNNTPNNLAPHRGYFWT